MSQSFLGELFLPRCLVTVITPPLLMTIIHELSSGCLVLRLKLDPLLLPNTIR